MFLAKVVGNVWATRKIPILEEKRMLLIQNYDPATDRVWGEPQMAVSQAIDAGVGDVVLILDEGSSAKQHFNSPPSPVRTFVFAIIDQVNQKGEIRQIT